jgi:Glyoxalase-like domain
LTLRLDHLAVSCLTLAEGVAFVENALGLPMGAGGKHTHMSTHNRLLSFGDVYLEVIAADPDAPSPAWPRWFDLDAFSGPPRLTNWVAGCDDLTMERAQSPDGTGTEVALSRGDYRWSMAVPSDGKLPFDGTYPALIQWHTPSPAPKLPDVGARLQRLEIAHPQAAALRAALAGRMTDPRVVIVDGMHKAMQATIITPHGTRTLS